MARRSAVVLPSRPRRRGRVGGEGAPRRPGQRRFPAALVALPLAAFTAVFLWDGPRPTAAVELAVLEAGQAVAATRFELCNGMGRFGGDCVIDGDTFWYGGEKIRIADLNTPEVSEPGCAREARLGAAATARLQALLNQGAFTLETIDRDRDHYGRALRIVTRDGESLGAVLVDEGLAEEWRGRRGSWC